MMSVCVYQKETATSLDSPLTLMTALDIMTTTTFLPSLLKIMPN